MDQQLQEFEERLGKQLNEQFGKIDERFNTLSDKIDGVETRISAVDARVGALNDRVGVLHEHAMAEFKVSLEAVQGTRESLLKRFDERADGIESRLDLVSKAVRANQQESLADRARRR